MMHATQNEEQLCPNPNLKCTREWVGFGWLGMRIKLSKKWDEDPTAINSSLCGWLCDGDGGGEWGTSFSKRSYKRDQVKERCLLLVCLHFARTCCLKSLSIRHFLGVPKVVFKCSPLSWVGLELQFLELINVSTEVIIILFLCKSFKIYMPGMGICPPNTFFCQLVGT
jgi:hypothetical protein